MTEFEGFGLAVGSAEPRERDRAYPLARRVAGV
jgi:hypothetical protein